MALLDDPQSRGYARMTGIAYFTIAVAGAFAIGFVPSQLHVAGDMAATFDNILTRRGLFNAGIGADAIVMLAEIFATAMLFFMFKPVNTTLSASAALARLTMVAIMAAMLFFHAGALMLADPGVTLAGFTAEQRIDLAGVMLHMHDAGVWIWQLFFFLHLALLGWLVAASGRFPKIFGYAMTLGAFGYLADSIFSFAAPDFTLLGYTRIGLLTIVTLAEVGFALWLIIRGPRDSATAAPGLAAQAA